MIVTTNMHADDCELHIEVRTLESYRVLHVLKLQTQDGAGVTVFATLAQLAEIAATICVYLTPTAGLPEEQPLTLPFYTNTPPSQQRKKLPEDWEQ